jgi:hypothetical protein
MRIDPYGMRHLPIKSDGLSLRTSVDVDLKKQRSHEEQRALQERLARPEEELRPLSDAEQKARGTAQQQIVLRTPEERRRFELCLELDNALRQAMTRAAWAYVQTRSRALARAGRVLQADAALVGIQSGDGPFFELTGACAHPAWRLGRGAAPQDWDVTACGEQLHLVEAGSGQIRSEWDGARHLAQELHRQLEAALPGAEARARIRIRWSAPFPSLEESSQDLFELPLASLGSSVRLAAVQRYNTQLRHKSQAALREQPPPPPGAPGSPRSVLELQDGRLVATEARPAARPAAAAPTAPAAAADARESFVELLGSAARHAALAGVAASEAERARHELSAAQQYDRAGELLLQVSSAELQAANSGAPVPGNPTIELLKLARDHLQAHGSQSAGALLGASRQAVEDQRRARSVPPGGAG